MVAALFKDTQANATFLRQYADDTRIIRYWLHQPTRLTDGHIALTQDGTARYVVNWSRRGTHREISYLAQTARLILRGEEGFECWTNAQLSDLLRSLGAAPQPGHSDLTLLADILTAPILSAERAGAENLSLHWEVDDKHLADALSHRFAVVQKAEAILNEAGLLVDPEGTIVSQQEVSATLKVSEFKAAQAVLRTRLHTSDLRYNCKIING